MSEWVYLCDQVGMSLTRWIDGWEYTCCVLCMLFALMVEATQATLTLPRVQMSIRPI